MTRTTTAVREGFRLRCRIENHLAQKSRFVNRATDARDKTLLLNTLGGPRSAGYELHQENPNFLQFNAAAEATFPLDLMFVNDATFAKMQAAAVPSPSGRRECA